MVEIILASKSKVRKEILDKNNINNQVKPSNVDEDIVKLEIPTGAPMHYVFDQSGKVISKKNLIE